MIGKLLPPKIRKFLQIGLPVLALTAGGSALLKNRLEAPPNINSICGVISPDIHMPFDSAEAALNFLIETHQPQVLAFGELHTRFVPDHRTAGEYFADSLPFLAENGFRDLVYEHIPDDPRFMKQLELYQRTNRLDEEQMPDFYLFSFSSDYRAKRSIVRQSYDSGINIYGATLPLASQHRGMEQESSTWLEIKNTTLRHAREVLNSGRKVILFNGRDHNDTIPNPISFGPELSAETSYLEIDLVTGDFLRLNDSEDYPERRRYLPYIPESGVILIQRGPNSYTILFSHQDLRPY